MNHDLATSGEHLSKFKWHFRPFRTLTEHWNIVGRLRKHSTRHLRGYRYQQRKRDHSDPTTTILRSRIIQGRSRPSLSPIKLCQDTCDFPCLFIPNLIGYSIQGYDDTGRMIYWAFRVLLFHCGVFSCFLVSISLPAVCNHDPTYECHSDLHLTSNRSYASHRKSGYTSCPKSSLSPIHTNKGWINVLPLILGSLSKILTKS